MAAYPDYTLFDEPRSFPGGTVFGDFCVFAAGTTFGPGCTFGDFNVFGANSHFRSRPNRPPHSFGDMPIFGPGSCVRKFRAKDRAIANKPTCWEPVSLGEKPVVGTGGNLSPTCTDAVDAQNCGNEGLVVKDCKVSTQWNNDAQCCSGFVNDSATVTHCDCHCCKCEGSSSGQN